MLEWILSNLKLIVSGILVIISVIVFILRKPTKNTIIDNGSGVRLATYIKEAEDKYGSGHGAEKMQYVLDRYFADKKPTQFYVNAVKQLVEFFLSLPSKK